MILVKNVENSSSRSKECRHCGFFIVHYRHNLRDYKTEFFQCSELNCFSTDNIHGAHVKLINLVQITISSVGRHSLTIPESKNYQYIVPLCAKHNHFSNDQPFHLKKEIIFVRANQTLCLYRGRKAGLLRKLRKLNISSHG